MCGRELGWIQNVKTRRKKVKIKIKLVEMVRPRFQSIYMANDALTVNDVCDTCIPIFNDHPPVMTYTHGLSQKSVTKIRIVPIRSLEQWILKS